MRVVQMSPYSTPSAKPVPQPPLKPEPSFTELPKVIDFKRFRTDDWIILGIIAALILEGSEDYILLCALGYLFIMGL